MERKEPKKKWADFATGNIWSMDHIGYLISGYFGEKGIKDVKDFNPVTLEQEILKVIGGVVQDLYADPIEVFPSKPLILIDKDFQYKEVEVKIVQEHKVCVHCRSRHKSDDCRFECKECEQLHSRYIDCERKKLNGKWFKKGSDYSAALEKLRK